MTESIPYAFVVSGIVACGWLMTQLTRKLRLTPIRQAADEATVQQTIKSVRSGLQELRNRLALHDEGEPDLVPPDRREQVSGLWRRGRNASEIATMLGVTEPEVRFLLKVQAAIGALDELRLADSGSLSKRGDGNDDATGRTTKLLNRDGIFAI